MTVSKRASSYIALILFGLCMAPTFISYKPYYYRWDDADYLQRCIMVSRGVWGEHLHQVAEGIHSNRLPIMMLLGVPWGPLSSWDAAGKCFVSLAVLIALMMGVSLYVMRLIGMRPLPLVVSSFCLFATMGLGPLYSGSGTHRNATAFMADNLVGWTSLAALLLIPLEAKDTNGSTDSDILRGILWGFVFSMGVLGKVTFFYFVILILPILLVLRYRKRGLKCLCVSFATLGICSVPAVVYWLRFGGMAWKQAATSSFGRTADLYYAPLGQFLSGVIRESPGLLLTVILVAGSLIYTVGKKSVRKKAPTVIALLISIGFFAITLASTDRLIRFAFPAIVSMPFLAGLLLSNDEDPVCGKSAFLSSLSVFCALVLASTPMLRRPDRASLATCDAVLAAAEKLKTQRILLATDSAALNADLMRLAVAVSPWRDTAVVGSLNPLFGTSIEQDFRTMRDFDLVVFQTGKDVYPPFTNQRSAKYESQAQRVAKGGPIKVSRDVTLYELKDPSKDEANFLN